MNRNKSIEERIAKDITLFEENIKKIKEKHGSDSNLEMIIDLAIRYYNDAKYYLGKKDYLTSFGCINYAHGLLDAILKRSG
jgi:hypothetical protein